MSARLRAIIVDDEALAREAIALVLLRRRDVEIVAECGNGADALEAIATHAPDLVFLDVRMPGLDGLEVAQALDMTPMPFVVFVTAYDEYAVRAFEVEALDYLVKPVDDERLNQCVDRAAKRRAGEDRHLAERIRAVVGQIAPRGSQQFLAAGPGGKVVVVRSEEIHWIEAADNYVRLHTARGVPMLRETLKSLERRLDPERFVRVHRSCLVDALRVREMRALPSGDYELVLDGGATVPMSRTHRDAVFARLGGPPR
jgi:two-component system, LytTR family, response regulator